MFHLIKSCEHTHLNLRGTPARVVLHLAVRGIGGENSVPPLINLTSAALNHEGVGEARTAWVRCMDGKPVRTNSAITLRFHFDFQHIS